jgi:hypothetical protein
MLNAILRNKRRGLEFLSSDEPSESLLTFSGAEDLLTAGVFERLLYLSDTTLTAILERVVSASGIPQQRGMFGTLSEYKFWPSWSLKDDSRVEPDCLLRFTKADVIIEAKRWDFCQQQYPEQWAKEFDAYFEQHSQDKKRVFLFAIGGFDEHQLCNVQSLKQQPQVSAKAFELLAQSWAGLWRILHSVQDQDTLPANERRIIDDIRHTLSLHAIRLTEPGWLKELPQYIAELKPNMDAALTFFAAASPAAFAAASPPASETN